MFILKQYPYIIFLVFFISACAGNIDVPHINIDPVVIMKDGSVFYQNRSRDHSYQPVRFMLKQTLRYPVPLALYTEADSYLELMLLRSCLMRLGENTAMAVTRCEHPLFGHPQKISCELYRGKIVWRSLPGAKDDHILFTIGNFIIRMDYFSGVFSSVSGQDKIEIICSSGRAVIYNSKMELIASVNSGEKFTGTIENPVLYKHLLYKDIIRADEIKILESPQTPGTTPAGRMFKDALRLEEQKKNTEALALFQKTGSFSGSRQERAAAWYKSGKLFQSVYKDYNRARDNYIKAVFMSEPLYSSEACLALYELCRKNDPGRAEGYLQYAYEYYPRTIAGKHARALLLEKK
ncbi:MAG: hypothetical protein A2096_05925 [Spirochaetes bacterium GWF1_41_5]|nr:MAG: hypothetical protein A2096_05925 [Spirochaetes bacterium GWF1_41_5]HBE01255.1 hypothetical protein [Spirochaetia bacterium]